MSVDMPDSPVRGMVPMRDYLRVVRRLEIAEEELHQLRGKDKPVLLAHEVEAGGAGRKSRPWQRREPKPNTVLGRVLEALRRSNEPLPTSTLAEIVDLPSSILAMRIVELVHRGYVVRADAERGPGHKATWRAV